MTPSILVMDRGQTIAFSFEEMMKYHGPGSPGGVAHAFKVMDRAWPLLDSGAPPKRRDILKREMASCVMAAPAEDVYDVTRASEASGSPMPVGTPRS